MGPSRNRKQLFVDARVQGVLIRQIVKHWIVACTVVFLYLLIMQVFTTGERLTLGQHLRVMAGNYGILIVAMATVLPVFAYDSIKLSNRFAGPMVSFRNSLHRLAHGQTVNSLTFRKSDFWHDISTDLNSIARRMELLDENHSGEVPSS